MEDEEVHDLLHGYLFQRYSLLDRVVRARRVHHSRLFSLSLDYGHKAYLDKLTNERFVTLGALEHLGRRTAEVLYREAKWFKWVRQEQDEEEEARENESKILEKEALLFKRHWKEAEARMKLKRREEDIKIQEIFLDEAYQQRMQQTSEDEEESEWDPIVDDIEQDRQVRRLDEVSALSQQQHR